MLISGAVGLPPEIPRGKWLDTDYGKVVYTRNPHFYFPISTVIRTLFALPQADVLHLSLVSYPAAWGPAILNLIFGRVPVLWSVHGELDPPMLLRSPKKKRAVLWIIRSILKLRRRPALYFHSTCAQETEYIQDNFGQDQHVLEIPNYMLLPDRIVAPAASLNGAQRAEVAGNYLLFIGRIDAKKGLDRLIDALPLSIDFMRSDFRLRIVGDANNTYGDMLRRKVREHHLEDKVVFLGHRAGIHKQALLAAAACLVMPSHTENFGIVVTEALAQGTPAIASTGTPWQSLVETGAGWWCDNRPEVLAKAIDEVLRRSPEEVAEMSRRALQLVTDRFDIWSHIDKWDEAYKYILQHPCYQSEPRQGITAIHPEAPTSDAASNRDSATLRQ